MFSRFHFSSIFPGGSADPIYPSVRTPMKAKMRAVQDTLQLLLDCEAKIGALRRRSDQVVPVHQRKLPVGCPLSVVSLANYRFSDEVVCHCLLCRSARGVQ